ncbi:MAG TPA: Fe-S cluster assembly protein SufD [Pyrinomonadaceae bacterium]|nr:Fe-S cluster assembly protein SufD [Pyrinomonadaceae bacterium]
MAQATQEKSRWRAAFDAQSARRPAPSWVEELRREAVERFDAKGFPTTAEEDWKYTNVAPIARADFAPVIASEIEGETDAETSVEPFIYAEARASRLVFIDGRFRPEHSATDALPAGVVAVELNEALQGAHAETLHTHLARGAEDVRDGFELLNTAFLDTGAFILIPQGVEVAAPIHLLFLSTMRAGQRATFPRIVVVAEPNSSATLIESYTGADEAAYLTDAVVDVSVGAGARLAHYKVQREGEQGFHIAATRAALDTDASYDLTTITLGARLSRHGIEVLLDHEGAECWVDGLYLVGDGQHADTHSLIDHRRPHCTSHQNYKGILDGKSRAVFNGRVFVRRDAQHTDAVQSNKNLLLSPEARVDTKPQLEIFADDVKCAHGATVGQLEEEQLFYLASRGLHMETARNLLTYGFAEEIVEKIRIDSIKAQLDEAILNRLHARLEA